MIEEIFIGNIRGTQGIQGPKGDKGDKGEKGEKGDSGTGGGVSTFDVVVRTQAEFEELYNSPDWLGAKSVAFIGDGGTLEFSKSTTGLKIPQTVKQIKGFNSAKIYIMDFGYYPPTVNPAGMWYETKPTINEYSIEDINLMVSFTTIEPTGRGNAYGFHNCINLIRCVSHTTISVGSSAVSSYGVGFSQCTNLFSCESRGISKNAYYYGFENCSQLINCNVSVSASGTSVFKAFYKCIHLTSCNSFSNFSQGSIGFELCEHLTSCTYTGSCATNMAIKAFVKCTYLNTCVGDVTNTGNTPKWGGAFGFIDCSRLNGCTGTAIAANGLGGDIPGGSGFENCSQLINCSGTGIVGSYSTVIGSGFSNCTQLTNCTGSGNTSNNGTGAGYGYGFYNCSYSNGCKSGTMASKTALWGGASTFRDDDSCQLVYNSGSVPEKTVED